jgi:DNA-binding NarL/FixJ family response regulator
MQMDNKDIKVVIIDEDEIIRNGYSYLIGNIEGISIVNTYSFFEEALKGIVKDDADLVLLDIKFGGTNSTKAISELKKIMPNLIILVLTSFEYEKLIFESFANGASSYICKNNSTVKIGESIKRSINEGEWPINMELARMITKTAKSSENVSLSKIESKILEMTSLGMNRNEIVKDLTSDDRTIKGHIRNIYSKLAVQPIS